MQKATRKGGRAKAGYKWAVPRHRTMAKASASRCEKAIETVTRREGKKACDERE